MVTVILQFYTHAPNEEVVEWRKERVLAMPPVKGLEFVDEPFVHGKNTPMRVGDISICGDFVLIDCGTAYGDVFPDAPLQLQDSGWIRHIEAPTTITP